MARSEAASFLPRDLERRHFLMKVRSLDVENFRRRGKAPIHAPEHSLDVLPLAHFPKSSERQIHRSLRQTKNAALADRLRLQDRGRQLIDRDRIRSEDRELLADIAQ